MFEAQLKQSSIFRKVLEAIGELLNEANFDWTDSGLSLQAMDNSHVSLVSLNIRSDGFDKYRCDRNLSMGVNLGTMKKVLKCSANDDILTLKADNDDSLRIKCESSKCERVSEYDMKLMDIQQEQLGIPDTDFSCVARMASGEFLRICKDLSQFGESTTISCCKEGIKFSASGDLGSACIRLSKSEAGDDEDVCGAGLTIELRKPVTLTFATRFLNTFTKASSLSPQVTLSMRDGIPLVVEYQIGDIGQIRYFLAPKVDEDGT